MLTPSASRQGGEAAIVTIEASLNIVDEDNREIKRIEYVRSSINYRVICRHVYED